MSSTHSAIAGLAALLLTVGGCNPRPYCELYACVSETTTSTGEDINADTAGTSGNQDTSMEVDDTDTSEDGTDTANTGNGTGLFVPVGDFGNVSECDPFLQDCPLEEKCVPYGSPGGNWDANKCVPVTGDGQPDDTCTWNGISDAGDDCRADSHCWDVMDVDGALVGVCTEFCTGTPDDPICPPDTACLIANNGSINLCVAICDPLLQECTNGLACFWANSDFQCIFTTQDIPTGEPCGFINDCAAGHLCASADVMPECAGSACCASYCDLLAPECPQAGTECTAFFEEGMAPPGHEDVGVCILPG